MLRRGRRTVGVVNAAFGVAPTVNLRFSARDLNQQAGEQGEAGGSAAEG